MNTKDNINKHILLKYVDEAIDNELKGLSHKPEKNTIIVSDFFQDKINNDTLFAAAFEKFSPYKQKEFIEYIDTAKQEKTKITRLEKIERMIFDHKGLNDKYK